MKPAPYVSLQPKSRAWSTLWSAVAVVLAGCRSTAPPTPSREPASRSPALPAAQPADPDRPPPVLPAAAFLLSEYAALELTITAARDGSVQQVVVSKPSRAKLYDEYTRDWVAKRWKMPAAKPGEPEVRKFIAPIVYPQPGKIPDGHLPPPPYPFAYVRDHVEGLVVVEIGVAPSGEVETARVLGSSGHKGLDDHTVNWVRKKWRFPPGGRRWYCWPVIYLMMK